jgi:hypothetical protein
MPFREQLAAPSLEYRSPIGVLGRAAHRCRLLFHPSPLEVDLTKMDGDYVAEAYGAVAIANTIAFVGESIDPVSIFISLTRRGLTGQAIRDPLLGEGETGLMVYAILLRYWEWTQDEDVRPLIFLMSD